MTFANILVAVPLGIDSSGITTDSVWCESFGQFIESPANADSRAAVEAGRLFDVLNIIISAITSICSVIVQLTALLVSPVLVSFGNST